MCLFTHIVCPVPHLGDFMEDFGFDRDTLPRQNPREWQRGYIGLPSQRKMSNCDVSAKDQPQNSREAEEARPSFCDTDKSASASIKG